MAVFTRLAKNDSHTHVALINNDFRLPPFPPHVPLHSFVAYPNLNLNPNPEFPPLTLSFMDRQDILYS